MITNIRVKKALVTGGSSGIGLSISKAMLLEGCSVCICGRNFEKLEKAKTYLKSDKLYTIPFDVLNINEVGWLIERCAEYMGGVDALVNSAGISSNSIGQPGWGETEQVWDSILDINLKATIFLTRKFAEYFKANEIKGNILNISSTQGATVKMISAYQAAKSAVIHMTRGMAKDMAPYGIVINGIAPGVTFSGMTPRPKDGRNETKLHANGIVIEPDQIAQVAMFLLSEAGSIVIGDTIFADAGFKGAI